MTKNFTFEELIASEKADELGINNTPKHPYITENLRLLALAVLQPARDHIGEPIEVESGWRSKALNRAVGGVETSQHRLGEAADIKCVGSHVDIFNYILKNLEFDQLIAEGKRAGEPKWIHVSFRKGSNRGQALIAKPKSGEMVYLPYSQEAFDKYYG